MDVLLEDYFLSLGFDNASPDAALHTQPLETTAFLDNETRDGDLLADESFNVGNHDHISAVPEASRESALEDIDPLDFDGRPVRRDELQRRTIRQLARDNKTSQKSNRGNKRN
eukprot:TRINITY_DN13219_c0_g1_i6.p2 TRINITY_DN13219_c0_g1~~TRINITY_DN13219_c0_g1_i6.p2  ORF type:complete len:113 (-),score=7.06 TRINITY_DN13219_c0_g1_i6:32-370(-)